MAGLPTLLVEVEFTAGVWTDITGRVLLSEGVSRTYGRGDQYSEVQPGTLELTVDNSDGRFTAGYTSGLYWPNVKVGKAIRLSHTFDGVLRRRSQCHVNEWPTAWPAGQGGTGVYVPARITATDASRRLNRGRKLRSVLQEEILYDGPVAYWPLGEPEGSTIAADVSGPSTSMTVGQAGGGGALTFGSGTGPPRDGLPAVQTAPVDADNGKFLRSGAIPGAVVGGVCTLECWALAPTGVASGSTVMTGVFGDRRSYLTVNFDATGRLVLRALIMDSSDVSTVATVTTAGVYANALTHHIVGVCTVTATAVTVTLYVDGALRGTQTTAGTGLPVPTTVADVAVGAYPPRYGYTAGGLFAGTFAHAAVYGKAVTPAQSLAHYLAGVTGFAGEKTDVRITRLARYAGITSLALDAGASGIAAQDTAGQTAHTAMVEAVQAEDGLLFFDGQGRLVMQSKTRRFNQATSFTLTAGTVQEIGADTVLTTDDSQQVNDAAYTRSGGATQRALNLTSIAADGTYGDERTLLLATDNEVLDRANWAVQTRAVPAARCPAVTVDLLTQPTAALVTSVLGADLSARFTVNGLPSQAPGSSVDLIVEGVTERLSATEWTVTFNTSPGSSLGNIWQFNTMITSPLTFGV